MKLKEIVYIQSNDGTYKQCKDYNEAIKLQNDARSKYNLGLIVWERGV